MDIDYKKQEYYPTPKWCIEALLDNEKFEGNICDPACGKGHIVKVLRDLGYDLLNDVYGVDKYDYNSATWKHCVKDFLTNEPDYSIFDNIITNPPFSIANEFVSTARYCTLNKIALLMRLAFLEGSKRQKQIFEDFPPTRVHVFSERITFYPDGVQTAGSGTMAMAWFVWDMNNIGTTTINWLNGYK